jgi:hypothetical protein
MLPNLEYGALPVAATAITPGNLLVSRWSVGTDLISVPREEERIRPVPWPKARDWGTCYWKLPRSVTPEYTLKPRIRM